MSSTSHGPTRGATLRVMRTGDHPERHIEGVVRRVQSAFPELVESDVEAEVRDAFGARADVPVRDFVPILVEREVVLRLRRQRQLV